MISNFVDFDLSLYWYLELKTTKQSTQECYSKLDKPGCQEADAKAATTENEHQRGDDYPQRASIFLRSL
jgi:hypothetical protein